MFRRVLRAVRVAAFEEMLCSEGVSSGRNEAFERLQLSSNFNLSLYILNIFCFYSRDSCDFEDGIQTRFRLNIRKNTIKLQKGGTSPLPFAVQCRRPAFKRSFNADFSIRMNEGKESLIEILE